MSSALWRFLPLLVNRFPQLDPIRLVVKSTTRGQARPAVTGAGQPYVPFLKPVAVLAVAPPRYTR